MMVRALISYTHEPLGSVLMSYSRCSRSRKEGVLQLLGSFHPDHAVDVCPVYQLYTTTKEDPGGP
jgi:hypothetical protein